MTDTLNQPGLESLSKSFEPAAIEAKWGPLWEQRGYGKAGYRGTGAAKPEAPAFSIQLPPPNVTGVLHMGHALNGAIQDALIRLNRMRGKRTKWILGTDHAGIATQKQVERLLETAREGIEAGERPWSERLRAARTYCLLEVLYATGLRVSELVALPASAARSREPMLAIRGKGGRERHHPNAQPAHRDGAAHRVGQDERARASAHVEG